MLPNESERKGGRNCEVAYLRSAPCLMQKISETIKPSQTKFLPVIEGYIWISTAYVMDKRDTKWLHNKFTKITQNVEKIY